MICNIVSERLYRQQAFWYVVYEWEDIFSQEFELICKKNSFQQFLRKAETFLLYRQSSFFRYVLHKITSSSFGFDEKKCNFVFIMNSNEYRLYTKKDYIPIFLDFYASDVDEIIKATEKLPLFYVTSYDVFKIMKQKGCKNVKYIPLSISDKYVNSEENKKTIDVIQFGRKNKILHEYMLKYCDSHKDVNYVYQTDGEKLTYYSTQNGDIGTFETRAEYFDLMSQCKVSLVSSPAVDGGRDFGEGIDFITPRFYESAANYCYMVGRYTENDETRNLKISTVCDNIKDYQQFEQCLDRYLSDDEFLKKREYEEFLENNKTSKRVETIKNDLRKLDR